MAIFDSATGVRDVIYLYLAVAFPLIMTRFHHRTLRRKHADYQAFLLYFAAFSALFLAVPILIIVAAAPSPREFLASVGLTFGQAGKGLLVTAAALPVAILSAVIGSRDPVIKAQYPFSKEACSSLRKFLVYEACYLGLYYLPWEFLFRGLLFFPLLAAFGLVPALAVQTIISTVYHFGHPDMEILGALGGGLFFGFVAYTTGSFLYTVVLHAVVGIGNDTFLYYRHYRRGRAS
jgi:membrane protease YdiL (CAAX protease family)